MPIFQVHWSTVLFMSLWEIFSSWWSFSGHLKFWYCFYNLCPLSLPLGNVDYCLSKPFLSHLNIRFKDWISSPEVAYSIFSKNWNEIASKRVYGSLDCKGYRHLLSPASQYVARDAIIATGLFISKINHVTRGSSSFHGFSGKQRSQGQISRHFYFGCKLILALALEFAAGLWHLEKHLLRSILHKSRTLIFFFLCTFFLQENFLLSENTKEEGEGEFSDLLVHSSKTFHLFAVAFLGYRLLTFFWNWTQQCYLQMISEM